MKPALHKARATLLAIAVASILAACAGETTPTPQATPTASPPPVTELTGDLAAAYQYEHDGQYEEAAAVYQRLVRQTEGQAQQEARYRLALAYITLERYADAVAELEAYIDSKPAKEDILGARFLLGRTYAALGESDKARQSLKRYADEEGPAALYASLELAQLLAQEGHHDKAAQELEKALTLDPPASLAPTIFLRLANAYREAGDDERAVQWYERLERESSLATDKALALFHIASLSRRLGDSQRWQQALVDIVELYPDSPQAANTLESLLMAEVPLSLLIQGIVHYHQRADDKALAAFDALLATSPPPAEAARALYYRGAIHARHDELEEALADYQASLQTDRSGDLAADAAWASASLLEELDRPLEAAAAYRQLGQAYPHSIWAARAAFLAGLIPYRGGDGVTAEAAWKEMLDAFPSPQQRAQAHLWLGKVALGFLADREGASAHFQQAVEAAPGSFHALRAEAWLEGQATAFSVGPDEATQAAAAPDWGAAEAWLTSRWGREEVATGPPLFDLPAWQRGQELHRLGLARQATDEFLGLIEDNASQPWRLYRLARALGDLGLTHLAARAATRLLEAADVPLQEAPRPLLELAYPQDYLPLVDAAARGNAVSPLLLLAMIRQESFFDPSASSPAGALGLTQVIPSTALEIAQKLKATDFSAPDLLRPTVSIQFGAYYLRAQLDLLDDNLYFALAAYNGGPGNALRWREAPADSDLDLFVEGIDLVETRSYVKLVLENYAVYRFLYAGADHPTLLAGPGPQSH